MSVLSVCLSAFPMYSVCLQISLSGSYNSAGDGLHNRTLFTLSNIAEIN